MNNVTIRPFKAADADWLIASHGRLYAAEAGFHPSFEALVAGIVTAFLANHDPRFERGWSAEGQGRLGSIFCVKHDVSTARLRLFLVEPEARGRGLGRRLLQTCLNHARERGFARLVLWTHESHRAACALYRAHGFACLSSRPVRSFGQPLVEQSWEIRF